MENLVTRTTEIEFARGTALRTSNNINDGALDVDVAAKCIDPAFVVGDVRVKRHEHEEANTSA